MRSLFNYFNILFLAALLTSCEKDVKNVRLPPFEQKLALASFITPSDTVSYIFVSSNRRIYGELGVQEETGLLSGTISDGKREVGLDTAKYGLQVSMGKMQIRYGITYTLNINSDKGLTASATCTVPKKREFMAAADTFSVPSPLYPQGYYQRSINMRVSIRDIQGEENYYRITGKGIGYRMKPGENTSHVSDLNISFEKEYFTDSGNDGKDFIVKSHSGMSYYYDYDSSFVEIYLYNLEKSYYLYHKSLDSYRSDVNPFTEISPVYSNIEGGLGIFTSYTVDTLLFRIK